MSNLNRNEILKAIDKIWWDAKRYWRNLENLRYYQEPEFERMELDEGSPGTNAVYNTHLKSENHDQRIREVVAQYMSRSDVMSWWVGGLCTPDNIGETLIELGFNPVKLCGMAMNLYSWEPDTEVATDLEINRVLENKELFEFFKLWVEALGDTEQALRLLKKFYGNKPYGPEDQLTYFTGYIDSELVAISAIRYFESNCMITYVGCKENHRKNGYGRVMTIAALKEAKKRGIQYAILHATELGSSMYRKIGFEDYNKSTIYFLDKENYKP